MNRVISVILRGDVGSLVGSMRAAGASVRETADRMTGASREAAAYRQNLSSVGDTAGKIGLAAVAGLGAIIVTTAKFDKAMSAVQAATHESTAAMEDLREAAIDAGAKTAFSASEAAQGIEELAKAGVSTESILKGGLNGALDLAAAGALEVGEAAEIAATAMTQFALDGSQVPHVADLLAAGAGKAQGSVQDMGAALGQSGLVAAQTGLTIEETTGTLAAFASAGLTGSDSGTSFKTMLQALTPTSQKAAEEMERLGISAYDSQGNFVGMTAFADSLKAGLKDLSVESQNAAMKTIFGADAVRAASVVFAQGGDGIQQWIDKVDDSGYASLTAATRLDNFSGDLEAFKGSLETALIGAGEGATGPLRELTQSATNAVNAFNNLPGPLKGTATAMLGVTAVLGGGLWFTAKTIAGVAAMRTNLAALGVTSAMTSKAMIGIGKAGAGLAAFWAGAELGDKAFDSFKDSVDELGTSLIEFSKTGKASGDLGKFFGDDLSGKTVRFGKDLGSIGEAIKSLQGYADDSSMTEAFKFIGSAGQSAGIVAQAEAIQDLDTSLAKLSKNKPEEAISAFEKLRDRATDTGASAEEVAAAFPKMAETLRSASEAMGGSSDAGEVLAGDLSNLGPASAEAAAKVQETTEALEKSRDAANDTALSFFNFARDAKQSFGDYLNELEKSADAFANFSQNIIDAGANGLDGGLIDQLKEQGPAGALALADFANASEKEIARANKAFRSTDGLVALQAELDQLPETVITEFATKGSPGAVQTALNVAAKYNMTPELVETLLKAKDYTKADIKSVMSRLKEIQAQHPEIPIGADIRGAMSDIAYLQRTINGMNGKTVRIAVKGGQGGGITMDANGSIHTPYGRMTHFANGGMTEKHEAQIASGKTMRIWAEPETGGEAYIPLAASKRPRSRAIAAQTIAMLGGSVEWYANGGIDGGRYDHFQELSKSSRLDLAQQQKRILDIEKSLREKESYGKGKNKKKRLALRGLDRTVAELELQDAKSELARMKRENKELKSYGTPDQEKQRYDAADDAVKEAERIVQDAAEKFTSAKTSATSKFGIGGATSAAAVDRNLGRLLVDSQTFLGLLGDLKAKGASPWLLAQLVEAGPTKGAIRLAREYNTNQAALDSINGRAAQIDAYSNQYAGLVGNAAFSQAGAWNSGISSASQAPMVASLVGAEIGVGSDGLMTFVKGQIVLSQDSQSIEARFS